MSIVTLVESVGIELSQSSRNRLKTVDFRDDVGRVNEMDFRTYPKALRPGKKPGLNGKAVTIWLHGRSLQTLCPGVAAERVQLGQCLGLLGFEVINIV